MKARTMLLTAALLAATAAPGRAGETRERKTVAARYRWDLTQLYKSDKAFEAARKRFIRHLRRLHGCKGKLGRGVAAVKRCLDLLYGQKKTLARLATYAYRKNDEDTRVTKYQGYRQQIDKLEATFKGAAAFFDPELLQLPAAKLRALARDKRLSAYDFALRELSRKKKHVLSPGEEAILAKTSAMRLTGYNVYSTFRGAEMQFPKIRVGKKRVRLTQALYVRYRRASDRDVRKRTFAAFFGTYKRYRRTLAALLASHVNAAVTVARIRKYRSALAAALDDDDIPVATYGRMIRAVNRYLPLLHRYLRLRKKLLGVKTLRYYDMYPSMISKVELHFPFERSVKIVERGLAPLGPEVGAALARGLRAGSGWVDVYPTKGKRSGAYMDGDAYDVHPYVLLNHLDDYGALTTLAHEMGHAVHSYLSNKNQPYPKSRYAIFVAEVASTTGEALLMEYMLAHEKDKRRRLFLLGQRLESFRTTLFRQAMFAEFERALYAAAEKGTAITADKLSDYYLKLVRRYYGHKQGVSKVGPINAYEWAYIPHFYYNFYVWQYATGMTAAVALAEKIRKGGAKARDRYVNGLLKAGASDHPMTLLRHAGVDLRTTRPYAVAMGVFRRTLREAEKLVRELKLAR